MWRTPEGDRVLSGAEGAFFREMLGALLDELQVGEQTGYPHETGVTVFDALSAPEKLAVLEDVGGALFGESVPPPKHTAVAEGAIYAVYRQAEVEIAVECDEGSSDTRRLVHAVCTERGLTADLPEVEGRDVELWADTLEEVADLVLFDRDWEIPPRLDEDPDAAGAVRAFMRIDDEYHVAVPPDPSPEQLARIRANLSKLVGRDVGGRLG